VRIETGQPLALLGSQPQGYSARESGRRTRMTVAETGVESLLQLRSKAAQATRRGDWHAALSCWEAINAQLPNDPAGYLGIGTALRETGRDAEAEAVLSVAIDRFPAHAGLAAAHAASASRRRDWPEALRRWERVLAATAAPAQPHWQAARADVLLELGRLDEAETTFRGLLHSDPSFMRAAAGMAQLAMRRRDWAEASRRWERAIAGAGATASANWQAAHAEALLELGRLDEAEPIFRGLLHSDPSFVRAAAGMARLAMRRRDWEMALALWDEVSAVPAAAPPPHWQAARAETLLELGRPDAAELAFHRLLQADQGSSRAAVGLARTAMRRGNWPEALARWDCILEKFGIGGSPYWALGRATTLWQLGRRGKAKAVLRALLSADPRFFLAWLQLIQLLMSAGEYDAALHQVSSAIAAGHDPLALVARKIDILIALQRIGEARTELAAALDRATAPDTLEALFMHIPRLFAGWPRTQAWLTMQRRLNETHDGRGSAGVTAMLGLRVLLALRNYDGFLQELDRFSEIRLVGAHRRSLCAIAARLREPDFPDRRRQKIFGIGLSKTGTTSLASALAILGFSTLHYLNPLTGMLISDDDVDFFDAATDTPVCVNLEKYFYMYPNSKFIYTTRPIELWQASLATHLARTWGVSNFQTIKNLIVRRDTFNFGARFAETHMTLYFNHADYYSAYHAHDRRVRSFFHDKPKERFLEFDIFGGDGWPQLCSFLGCPIPSQPFPWDNKEPADERSLPGDPR
jgi:tetratricopeptide (TPR) repeat protein